MLSRRFSRAVIRPRNFFAVTALAFMAVLASGCVSQYGALGADSGGPWSAGQSNGLWQEPQCGSNFDLYLGEVGGVLTDPNTGKLGYLYTAPSYPGVTSLSADNQSGIDQASQNLAINNIGVGAGVYWFLGGPNEGQTIFNESPSAFGASQASQLMRDFNLANAQVNNELLNDLISGTGGFPFVMADIEAYQNLQGGWYVNGTTQQTEANVAVWTSFVNTLQSWGVNVGVYSDYNIWSTVMGNSQNPTVEWTSAYSGSQTVSTSSSGSATVSGVQPCPGNESYVGLPPSVFQGGPTGLGARFYGWVPASSDNALIWQFSINNHGGSATIGGGYGDFDQIDLSHLQDLFPCCKSWPGAPPPTQPAASPASQSGSKNTGSP